MKQRLALGLLVTASFFCGFSLVHAQEPDQLSPPKKTLEPFNSNILVTANQGTIIRPQSSIPATANGTTLKTRTANTNIQIYMPLGWKPSEVAPPRPDAYPPYAGYAYETPESIACLYSLVTVVAGCNPNTATIPAAAQKR